MLLISFSGKSQVNLDSLWAVWNDTSQVDTSRLKAIKKIAWDGYLFSQPDSAFYFAQMGYDFAEARNNKKGMANALLTQGVSLKIQGNYENALKYSLKSLAISKVIDDKQAISASFNNIGNISDNQGNYEKALEYFLKSLAIDKELGDKKGMAASYNNIGNIYSNQGNYEQALEYNLKGLAIRKKIGDKKGKGNSYGNIGNIYHNQGNYEKALEYHSKSLAIDEELADKKGMGYSYNNIGNVYDNQGKKEKALEYYEKSLKIAEEIEIKVLAVASCNNLGVIYQEQGNDEVALDYFKKGLKICEEIGVSKFASALHENIGFVYYFQGNYEKASDYLLDSKNIKQEINTIYGLDKTSKYLSATYKKLGKYKQALEMHELYMETKDSLAKMDAEEELYKFEVDKEYQLKKQADSIKHDDEILIQQAQTLAKEEQLNSETQRRNGLVVISLLILMSLGLVFTQLKKVRKSKALVDEKQQEITDSINYAKRLQQGILVPFDLVQSWLSESFILFKPKDIVSGDFYWIEKVGDKIYFAVADCTGHGIPGALVSIICSNALSKALYEDKITAPAKILDATREIVEKRFVRSTDNIKDGMDISLCCLNVKTKTVSWAGAMNPLWIIKKDSNIIEELKPDRQAIGFVEKPKSFTEYKVKLQLNDSLYLFTDGYQDQFGGKKGKKYMKGKMKKFVLSIQEQDMQTQLASFDKEFTTWKGSHEQIDDVCVMGVRIT